mmetsp:Transcript_37445/g.105745  ORF Transcript_37445/g.105745 Transcript_37445/m.105745 type:complete len:213 (+) Transcript_37445:131-769(+)
MSWTPCIPSFCAITDARTASIPAARSRMVWIGVTALFSSFFISPMLLTSAAFRASAALKASSSRWRFSWTDFRSSSSFAFAASIVLSRSFFIAVEARLARRSFCSCFISRPCIWYLSMSDDGDGPAGPAPAPGDLGPMPPPAWGGQLGACLRSMPRAAPQQRAAPTRRASRPAMLVPPAAGVQGHASVRGAQRAADSNTGFCNGAVPGGSAA